MAAAAARPRGGRLYAALLHLYPASFRLEYGAEMRAETRAPSPARPAPAPSCCGSTR